MSEEAKLDEMVRFVYFSEAGVCGKTGKNHEEYCDGMVKQGYTLVSLTPLGGLDDRRDSYEGTLIYHWRKINRTVRNEELN